MKDHKVDWAGLRVRDGVGMDPGPIRDMLRAPDSGSGDEAYWRIEGTAFYSHELEEASEPLTQILIDAVCDGDGTPLGLMHATDMLVEITCGYTSPPRGGGRQCRSGRPVPGHRAPPPALPVPAGGRHHRRHRAVAPHLDRGPGGGRHHRTTRLPGEGLSQRAGKAEQERTALVPRGGVRPGPPERRPGPGALRTTLMVLRQDTGGGPLQGGSRWWQGSDGPLRRR